MRQIVKKYFSIICLLAFILISVLAVNLLVSISEKNINKSEYLISLRESSTVGCSSFWERNNDILVIGDSHSYAAFDYYHLAQLVGTNKISSCTMGGLYFETLNYMLKKIASQRNTPKIIIYGASLRQFTNGSDKEQQIAEHYKLLTDGYQFSRLPFAEIRKYIEGLFQSRPNGDLVEQRSSNIKKWAPIISRLDQTELNSVFDSVSNQSKEVWLKYLAQLKFQDDLNEQLTEFCRIVTDNKLKMIIVDIPESPYLSKLYSASQQATYSDILKHLSACSLKTVIFNNSEWGITNAHFINRDLDDNWNFNEIKRKGNELEAKLKNNVYNLDHMNLIGSQLFTEKLNQSIRDELKNAF